MTQEDKKLILKDISARLPYGVICNTSKGNGYLCSINRTIFGNNYGINIKALERNYFNDKEEIIKPYLRPLSSMTEEERKDMGKIVTTVYGGKVVDDDFVNVIKYIDWLNEHHFDYRGLIEKGLALEAPEELYKIN